MNWKEILDEHLKNQDSVAVSEGVVSKDHIQSLGYFVHPTDKYLLNLRERASMLSPISDERAQINREIEEYLGSRKFILSKKQLYPME